VIWIVPANIGVKGGSLIKPQTISHLANCLSLSLQYFVLWWCAQWSYGFCCCSVSGRLLMAEWVEESLATCMYRCGFIASDPSNNFIKSPLGCSVSPMINQPEARSGRETDERLEQRSRSIPHANTNATHTLTFIKRIKPWHILLEITDTLTKKLLQILLLL